MNHVANGPEPDDEYAHAETLTQNLVVPEPVAGLRDDVARGLEEHLVLPFATRAFLIGVYPLLNTHGQSQHSAVGRR